MSPLARTYPPVWRIDDWDEPWLPLPVRAWNALPGPVAARLLPLEEEGLLQGARRATGLDDFGDAEFREPLRILLGDLDGGEPLTPMGRITARTILHQQLAARLCLEDKIRRSPSTSRSAVPGPVFIAGLPRTGTTHLHDLLSKLRGLRYMPLWQTLHPATPPPGRRDDRRRTTERSLQAIHYILPLFRRMHEMETDRPHEELTVCALCYRSFFFEGAFRVPNYRAWYASRTHEKGYAYLKRTLQILQQEPAPGGKDVAARWILKSPQHVDQLETILAVFPDARIVLTHRDPARVVLSMITMALYASRQVYGPRGLRQEAALWVDRLEQMLRRSREQVRRLPAGRVLDVHFDDFMTDPRGTLERVARFAGVDIDADSRHAVDAHLASHGRDRHGRIDYRFEDLGLSEGELRERFSFCAD